MMNQDEMKKEEELPLQLKTDSPEGNRAMTALTAGPSEVDAWDDPEDEGVPEEEQEDPYEGRDLTLPPGVHTGRVRVPSSPVSPALPQEDTASAASAEEVAAASAAGATPAAPGASPAAPGTTPAASPLAAAETGAPAAQLEEKSALESAAKRRYWRRVLTGSAATVPDDVRRRAGVADASLSDEQNDYRLLSIINRSWAVDTLGFSREQVRSDWGRLRALLAKRFRVSDDERELFAALAVEAEDAPRREQSVALYESHYMAALLGKMPPDLSTPEGEEELPFAQALADEARKRGASLRRRYLPLAREVARGLDVFAGVEEDAIPAQRVAGASVDFVRAVEGLAEMNEEERQFVYAIAQEEFRAQHPQKEESLYRTALRASRRGATGLGIGVGQALAHASVATMDALGSMLGGKAEETLHKGAVGLDTRARIAEDLRRLLQDEVRPLQVGEEAGFAAQLMVDAAGAVPAAVAACCGGAGFATLGISGMGEAVAAARRRAPEGSQWLQYLAGVVGGGIQASIYSGMSRVGGQLLSNSISSFARASGKGVPGYTLSSLGVLGAMGFEEAKLLFAGKAAEAAGLGTQELAARLEKTASNIDWKAYGDNAQDVELNLREAAMNLPFILIGSGRVALRHFRSRDAVLGDGHALQQWGIDERTREAVMRERDMNRQGDLLRDALRGGRRWSAPGFLLDAARALRLLNTDYYQGFKDPKTVADFLELPSEGGLVPRPPFVKYSADNPEHVKLLAERYQPGDELHASRMPKALVLWDEWRQKAHLVADYHERTNQWEERRPGELMPTSIRRRYFGTELMKLERALPPRLRPGGFYAPQAEAERMALLRDRVAEIHDLTYQMLMSSFPLDALAYSSRGIDQLRQAAETARTSILESLGRSVLRRATGTSEEVALDELGQAVTNYFWRRRYTNYPPGWMKRVRSLYTRKLDEYSLSSFSEEMPDAPEGLLAAYRVNLGFRYCAASLYELLPTLPDFQTALARGLAPAEAYVHLLSRELGVDVGKAAGVKELLAPLGRRATDMRAFRLRNVEDFAQYSRLTGYGLECSRAGAGGKEHWRVRRPNGSYTRWHRFKSDAINDLVANAAFTFMPFSHDRMAALYTLRPGEGYDLMKEGKAGSWQYTGYDNLSRVALQDAARAWVESAPYAQPGFSLDTLRRYVYLGGKNRGEEVLLEEGEGPDSMRVDSYTLTSPLRLAQARFRTYWWRQLNSGVLSADVAGDELVKLRIIPEEELARVKEMAKPLEMPRRRDVPLRETPPPDVAGMNRALSAHLTEFSLRYFLSHLDDMPLPASTREWFRLAPLCTLEAGQLPERPVRISLKMGDKLLTSYHNRVDAHRLRGMGDAVSALRDAERAGLLMGSSLLAELRSAVGLNRARNLEQSWCSYASGGEAMMAALPAFWRLMERPLEGWKAMDEAEQGALRAHVEAICRQEHSPEAAEAEARGESPDYVVDGLRNLQEVLADYPALHSYGLVPGEAQPRVRCLVAEEVSAGRDPFAEPEYEAARPYRGGALQDRFRLEEPTLLPEGLQEDSRVLPALHLLGALRTFPAQRPYIRREGIYWKGELYGGFGGRHPLGLEGDWMPETPLRDLIKLLRRVDELNATLPRGEKVSLFERELPGLGEELDLAPLSHVTLYRHLKNPGRLCRLMPGEPEALHAAARTPYVVQTAAGAGMDRAVTLSKAEEMSRGYIPLEHFRPYKGHILREDSWEERSRASLNHTLAGVLEPASGTVGQGGPHGGIVSLRELLLRFVEDSGFSASLRGADPRELTSGQVLTLGLARELLLAVCGMEPGVAYRRLLRLGKEIAQDEEARASVLRTLFTSVDNLYRRGNDLLRPTPIGKKRRKASRRRFHALRMSSEDKKNLREWVQKHQEKLDEEVEFHRFNDNVRADGYSRGFFDD